ncbi:glutaredoxin [Candidatus Legionella polyplacis]|uniref:glutaredoxin family protein n=1 Tax=Candidatus Legionella polyplacis TaxID=2005262 RepID=UPI000C1EF429|nr:glutaredoxin domain-containing protein [Candidatus Legionella polyplacis]ATW02089.1 glutaredoxin [Candidatus Legionella polyplacis]
MKGNPDNPKCGFSEKAIRYITACNIENFRYIDVLENTDIRKALPKYSNWPTFPQLYVNGKLIGGSDIIENLFNQGKLKTILQNN